MSPYFCGIDFGTSNSSIAISSASHQPTLVELEGDKFTIPSTIFYGQESAHPIFGRQAVAAYTNGYEGRFMRSLKRVLGTDLMSAGTQINDKSVKFENILARFLKHLKQQAENNVQQEIKHVVMGRPVHFRDGDQQGDIRAEQELQKVAQMAGFEHIVFQFEPIAAAYAHEDKISDEKLACVVDIGGGTSDFSIIRLGVKLKNKINRSDDILASSGVRIGGNDFDKALCIKSFMPVFGLGTTYGAKTLPVPTSQYYDLAEWSKVNSVYNYKNFKIVNEVLADAHQPLKYQRLQELISQEKGHHLLALVEESKIELTETSNLVKKIDFLNDRPQVKTSKADFEKSIASNVTNISQSINECLLQAGVKKEAINLIVLTGGSTEIPFVQSQMCAHFPHAIISGENKLSSVGLGLAFDSRRRF